MDSVADESTILASIHKIVVILVGYLLKRTAQVFACVLLFLTVKGNMRDAHHASLSREEARTILLLSFKTARDCGLKLGLSRDEEELMGRKFVSGSH